MADNDQDAPHPAPHDDATHEAEHAEPAHEGERPEASPTEEPSPAPPARKKRGLGQKFTLTVSALGLLATLAGGAAIVFKDRDPRLREVADELEGAAKDPAKFLHEEESRLGSWLMAELPGSGATAAKKAEKPEPEKTQPAAPGALSPLTTGVHPAEEPAKTEAPKSEAQTGWAAPREIQPPTKSEAPAPDATPKAEAQKTEPPKVEPPKLEATKSVPPQNEAPVMLGDAEVGANAGGSQEIAALKNRLNTIEQDLHEARDAARAAQAAASGKGEVGGDKAASPEVKDKLAALQSRVEDLSEAVEGFRAQLEQPKVENRVAAEVQQASAAQSKALTAIETMALAHSLRSAYAHGEPYAGELAALQSRGADPSLLAQLAPFAERGAPQAKDLLAMFLPIGRRLRAVEHPAETAGSLGDQLLHDAEKLVRVRPVTQAAPNTAEDLVPIIERALAHDDLAAAAAAVAKLPDLAKGDAKSFADALNARVAGEKAASELLRQSVAALSRDKN